MRLCFKQSPFRAITHQIEVRIWELRARNLKCRNEFSDSFAMIHSTDSHNGRPGKRGRLNISYRWLTRTIERTIQDNANFLYRYSVCHRFSDRLAHGNHPVRQAHDYGFTVMHI